ncbi:MAG: hypothetical protein CVV27_05935 [Candidatus Melainabacteria bacterium HGW-Melainabacteria-1]|nr:MAG: hypothetical protein CVV27_05935 [Candidatus Melainabacteria bacterium HGW-Melainabacteria-1]
MENTSDKLPDYIPEQVRGKQSDVVRSDCYTSEDQARRAFRQSRAHMLAVNDWNRLAQKAAPGRTLAGANPFFPDFSLVDKPEDSAQHGDVIEMAAGGQCMYVLIEQLIEQADEFAIRVRTCDHQGHDTEAEHMYTSAATNTFRLSRQGLTVTTGFHGRNEIVNQGLFNRLVDLAMALGGRDFSWTLLGDAWRPDPEALAKSSLAE